MSHKEAVDAYNRALEGSMNHRLQSMALGVFQEAFRRLASDEELSKVTGLFEEHIRIWGKEKETA